MARWRADQTHCKNGHEITEANTFISPSTGVRNCKPCYIFRVKTISYPASRDRDRQIRKAVLALLGERCANPNCRWLNDDGTVGCTDERLLHVDHVKGGGNQERKLLGSPHQIYKKVLAQQGKGYRLLCANCNWLHRTVDF